MRRLAIPLTATELTEVLNRVHNGESTAEDARRLAELVDFLVHPAMARLEEYSFTTGEGDMAEMERMANAVAVRLGRPMPYPEAGAPQAGAVRDIHAPLMDLLWRRQAARDAQE